MPVGGVVWMSTEFPKPLVDKEGAHFQNGRQEIRGTQRWRPLSSSFSQLTAQHDGHELGRVPQLPLVRVEHRQFVFEGLFAALHVHEDFLVDCLTIDFSVVNFLFESKLQKILKQEIVNEI